MRSYVVLVSELCDVLAYIPNRRMGKVSLKVPFDSGALMITRRTLEGAEK